MPAARISPNARNPQGGSLLCRENDLTSAAPIMGWALLSKTAPAEEPLFCRPDFATRPGISSPPLLIERASFGEVRVALRSLIVRPMATRVGTDKFVYKLAGGMERMVSFPSHARDELSAARIPPLSSWVPADYTNKSVRR